MGRSSREITTSVWRALFLRDAMHRLFRRRGAWLWLLLEPVVHVGFLIFIFTVLRVKQVGGIDTTIWLLAGLLGFYMFRRTFNIGMGAITMAKQLLVYRQIKPVDVVLVRAVTEGVLMFVISIIIYTAASILGLSIVPDNGIGVLYSTLTLWLIGLGSGLLISAPRALVPEIGNIVGMLMFPIYLFSGVIFPIAAVPNPYRDWLLLNPIVHSLELMRASFSFHYAPINELDAMYPFFYSIVLIFFGLIVQRVYEKKVIHI